VAEVKQPHWTLDSSTCTATHLDRAPLMLNSFAKSYIIKRATDAAMAVSGVRGVGVNIGGDLVVTGDWKETVQISDPKSDAENYAPIDRLLIGNKAVATSGNYRRGELIAGHWYSHIVDPRTGIPADAVISATVVAPNATGNPVKPGLYTIKIEATREHGTYQLMRQELEWNGASQHFDLTGNIELSHVSLDYRKKSVGN
jgi:thiamine biosynthesis lipoprotein ApbE